MQFVALFTYLGNIAPFFFFLILMSFNSHLGLVRNFVNRLH